MFLQQLSGQELIYSSQLFNHLTETTGVPVYSTEDPSWHSVLQILHPVVWPKGVTHKCFGSGPAISYLCITYQSPTQPEKAITEFKPFAFVHSHSSLLKPVWSSSLSLLLTRRMCGGAKAREVCLRWHQHGGVDLGGTAPRLNTEISAHTRRSFSLMLRGLWLWTHKESLISTSALKLRYQEAAAVSHEFDFHVDLVQVMKEVPKSCTQVEILI